MPQPIITEEIKQSIEWRRRLLEAVLERKFDDEVLVTMLMAGFDQAHADGMLEAADMCKEIGDKALDSKRVAGVIENALRRLVEMNKAVDMALPTGFEPVLSE